MTGQGGYANANLTKDGFSLLPPTGFRCCLMVSRSSFSPVLVNWKSLARPELVSYLAECHVEFILIHPFREGNGRLSRLLCDVLSVLAGGLTGLQPVG